MKNRPRGRFPRAVSFCLCAVKRQFHAEVAEEKAEDAEEGWNVLRVLSVCLCVLCVKLFELEFHKELEEAV